MFVMATQPPQKIMILTLKNSLLVVFAVLASAAIWGMCAPFVLAQSSIVLSVSPTQFKMSADPGQTWSSSLRVINGNQTDIPVYLSVALFTADGETGQPRFITPPVDSNTLADWITVPSEPLIIPAEQAIQIPFTISLPEDAPPGGQYAALFVGTQPPSGRPGGSSVQTSQVIASLIFLQVSGDIVERGLIREFRTNQRVFNQPEASFVLRFENQGTVHLQPQGDITILNMWGEERGLVPINQKTFLGDVLPGQVRRFSFDWESEWALTDLGLYTAIATVGFGADTKQFVTSRTTFWVVPWKILLWVVGGLALFFWFVSWAVRMYIKRMLALAGLPTSDVTSPASTRSTPSIIAPLEAGMLDLRHRLHASDSNSSGLWSKTIVLTTFVYHYRIFFIVVLLLVVILSCTIWYFMHTAHMTRQYEVRVTERDVPVSFSNGRVVSDGTENVEIPVMLYHSGVTPTEIERMTEQLRIAGFSVTVIPETDPDARATSVILHSAGYQQAALQLSELFGGVLVSQYEVTESIPAGIQVRLGTDISVTTE